ncbi:MAG: restriction endonuclease subunit S [Azoarcus sp.]|nr:restriction endonuclease subunit S [Azoarcus sp.]
MPKLRFPEFRDVLPWKPVALKDVLRPVSREVAKPKTSYTGLGLRSHGKGTFQRVDQDPGKIVMDRLYEVHRDDLIVNITFAWEGAVAIAKDSDHGFYVSHRFPTYEFKSHVSSPDFFRYIITDKAFVHRLGIISPGGAGRNRVMNKNDFLRISTLLPSVREQQKIAGCLSSIDVLIASETGKLEALKAHKKGLMQQLFPAPGETTPRLRLPEFQGAGDWKMLPLSKFFRALDAGVSVNSGDRPASATEKGILKTSCVTNGIFDASENKVVSEFDELSRIKESVEADTIIISRMNAPILVGANAYIKDRYENIFLPDRLWAAKPRPGTCMRYIAHILGSENGRKSVSDLATGTSNSMKNISKSSILALEIPAPTPQEQRRIADFLDSIDASIAAQSDRVNALKAHKTGLMQQLFPAADEAQG